MKTILLVDRHPVFRKGIRSLLEREEDMEVVGEAGDGFEALDLVKKLAPSVVVLDVTMPALNGIEAARLMAAECPGTRILAVSTGYEKQFVNAILQAGASGCIAKESAPEELVEGIRTLSRGEGYLSLPIAKLIASDYVRALSSGAGVRRADHLILRAAASAAAAAARLRA